MGILDYGAPAIEQADRLLITDTCSVLDIARSWIQAPREFPILIIVRRERDRG